MEIDLSKNLPPLTDNLENAGKRWSLKEDDLLLEYFKNGYPLYEIVKILKRTENAILQRIKLKSLYSIVGRTYPVTRKQIEFLQQLGFTEKIPDNKKHASMLIDQYFLNEKILKLYDLGYEGQKPTNIDDAIIEIRKLSPVREDQKETMKKLGISSPFPNNEQDAIEKIMSKQPTTGAQIQKLRKLGWSGIIPPNRLESSILIKKLKSTNNFSDNKNTAENFRENNFEETHEEFDYDYDVNFQNNNERGDVDDFEY